MYSTILFEFDGTLVPSLELWLLNTGETFRSRQFDVAADNAAGTSTALFCRSDTLAKRLCDYLVGRGGAVDSRTIISASMTTCSGGLGLPAASASMRSRITVVARAPS